MTDFKTIAQLPRLIVMLTAGMVLVAAPQAAFAKNGGSDHKDHSGTSNSSLSSKSASGDKHKDKDKDKYSDKDKHKDKDGDKYSDKDKHKDKDKDKDGDKYTDKDKDKDKDKGTGTGTGTGTIKGTPIVNGNPGSPSPAAPPGDTTVRDHRPGGNAATPAPGTIIRDHTNGADGKPVVVVSSGPTGIVTRPATDADLKNAGLLPKPAQPAKPTAPSNPCFGASGCPTGTR
jgi:hypothetical protein